MLENASTTPTTCPSEIQRTASYWNDDRRKRCFEGRCRRFGIPLVHGAKALASVFLSQPRESHPDWNATIARVRSRKGKGFMFGLVGKSGNGKTQLGVDLLVEELVRRMRDDSEMASQPRYAPAATIFREIRDRSTLVSECAVFARYTHPTLLVIDELHERAETPFEERTLTHILDARYGNGLDTLLIANASITAFCGIIGPSVVSRIDERGAFINCTWPSFRRAV